MYVKNSLAAWLCVLFLILNSIFINAQELTALKEEAILAKMEKVADWQLNNPVRFDVTYKKNGELEQARILWEGLLTKTREGFNDKEVFKNIPADWKYFCSLVGDDATYLEIPQQIKNTLTNKLDVAEEDIVLITMGDGTSKSWEIGAFYAGLLELSKVSKNSKYFDALKMVGEASKWKLGDRIYHADDHCVGQMYLELYKKYNEIEMLANVQMQFDWIIKNPHPQTLRYSDGKNRWSWCDALFMSPPVWVKLSSITGDKKYIDYMNEQYSQTYDHLYDKEEKLFYRDDRYYGLKEPNGKKIFWSRGNGWVISGLAMILNEYLDDYPGRGKYEKLFKEMAERILELQPADGLFRSSLLDPVNYPVPESSSTAFFTYAMAWGINNGYLEKEKYLPFILKSWEALQGCINEYGKMGYVQLPGSEPGEVHKDWNATYGAGSFLLAGTEIIKMIKKNNTY
ncbi:MAG: glycoside hydrolase family 88 protein [Ignavibacteria bacterium]|jgi:rhamnogalacturonyl hydrolase YesR